MKKNRAKDPIFIIICALGAAIIICCAYLAWNYWYVPAKINAQNERYADIYESAIENGGGIAPSTAAPLPSEVPAETEAAPTPAPTGTPAPDFGSVHDVLRPPDVVPEDVALGTPNADTIVYAAPTPPPALAAFDDLRVLNPDTAGFLKIGDMIRLPVVQRTGDNDYYLTHSFAGDESASGCLFIDGSNRLFPADECIYIYGHNMKNGTMFGDLSELSKVSVLKQNPIAYIDTIYERGIYVPFACFALTADASSAKYFELRKFAFTDESFAEYVSELKSRSTINIPVDVSPGDRLVLLVTCNYSINDGRFVVAYRRLRDSETEQVAAALVSQSQKK